MKEKVAVGMSGGVDSSVTAYLLKEKGYDVIGVQMKLFQGNPLNKERESLAERDAKKVADSLQIPFYTIDLTKNFKKYVIDYFIYEYSKGRTPNPCVICNKHIKFDAFLNECQKLGAKYIATGHYSRIEKVEDRYLVRKAVDPKKDQSYVLYNLTQNTLEHTLMPCGEYSKDEIREIAKKIGLEVHNKKDSEDICFIPDKNHGAFISKINNNKVKTGNFVDKYGNVLGKHKGIVYYTIGQRKGLGIALGKPAYVIDIISEKNQVVIGEEEDIFKKELIAKDVNYILFDKLKSPIKVEAKIRYSALPSEATLIPISDNEVKVVFKDKQRALTKGQSVVFYIEDILVGGGIIDKIIY
ncbi:tRNA-specific 2-thiouridylase MnmA [Clostridium acetireducens DSM 10703]|jgi:tRNA-specific 2-thiouridylase|uniref:tRNA-specific 2-thiouridylase MnmA n=1 Tax=Clostridium acetireducens DSM 10703 TaxID=1121290 RepID=A0A1E8EXB1_9CLOT|nr:tRNA 2-thiouridine(34) synthase MnmA [Clostridium acetireducens]OFI05416.1 tRNA-specific 2-thiouridylase MnmA [Clostridium acetireducens DSM 10703]